MDGSGGRLSREDLLSSLPDDILINILSRLQIDSAAATSILSRRWQYLWTTITTFKFDNDGLYVSEQTSDKFSSVVLDIVRQLTSRTLRLFKIKLSSLSNLRNPSVAEPCFRELCSRNVEEIIIIEESPSNKDWFTVPRFLFSSKNLVVLVLQGKINFDLTENTDIQLFNLKKISVNYLVNCPQILGSLFSSCQCLIDAKLIFQDYTTEPEPQIVVNISAPNLISLKLKLLGNEHKQRPKILIDAPKLETLHVSSYISDSYSIKNPMKLVKASIHMFWNEEFTGEEQLAFQQDVFKLVGRMSSVTKLTLCIDDDDDELVNVYRYLDSVNLWSTFHNLECLNTDLDYVGWKDLLVSMKCFPNLRHLKMFLMKSNTNLILDPVDWCVPECLTKLKTVIITAVDATDIELRMLVKYILTNALALEKLHIECTDEFGYNGSDKKNQLWNAIRFCKSLFRLRRASSTIEIVFSISGLITASSNDFKKNGSLTCEISGLIDIWEIIMHLKADRD